MHTELFDLLETEHNELRSILSNMLSHGQNSVSIRRDLAEQMECTLISHMKGEEKAFYTELRKHDETRQISLESLEAHHIASVLWSEMVRIGVEHEMWTAKAKVLKDILELHMAQEEKDVFVAAKKAISDDQMETIFHQFRRVEQEIEAQIPA